MFQVKSGDLINCFLTIATLTGMILIMQYDASRPLDSTVFINSITPFGWFWRGLHYWSSQFFLLTLLYHTYKNLNNLRDSPSFNKQGLILILSIYLSLLLTFSGYILRGDELGRSAANVAIELTKTIPFVGHVLNAILFDIKNDNVFKILGLHINLTLLIWLMGSWYHIKGIKLTTPGLFYAVFTCTLITCIYVPKLHSISNIVYKTHGPWFFVGLQELLKYLHPLIAGVLYPIVPLLALHFIISSKRYTYAAGLILKFWIISYVIFTILGFSWYERG